MTSDVDRGVELLQAERFDEAKAVFESILVEDPSNPEALCNIGITFTEMGENDKAIKALSFYIKLDDRNPDAFEAMGCAYLRKGSYDSAKVNLERAIELNPRHASALRNLGVLYSLINDGENSYRCLLRSAEINPDDYLTQYALSAAHAFYHHFDKAKSILRKLLVSDIPDNIRRLAENDLERLDTLNRRR